MIKNWDLTKHIIVSVILSICVVLIAYILIKPTEASSMGIITSTDGSGSSAIYYTNDTYKVVISGAVAFVLSMGSYLLLKKIKIKFKNVFTKFDIGDILNATNK